MASRSKRNHIIEVAYQMFSNQGFHSINMGEIITEAKISKRTMYKHFPTKNTLIVESLEFYKQDYETKLKALVNKKKPKDPISELQIVFDLFLDTQSNKLSHGCLAIHAIAEFSDKNSDILKACHEFKEWQFKVIKSLVLKAELKKPNNVANDLFTVLEGLTVIAERTAKKEVVKLSSLLHKIIKDKI